MRILDAYGVLSLARGFVSENIRWEADPMRRGVGQPVTRLCCFLCPVCPPAAQPVIWGHPVTTADREGVRPFSGPGGAVGARGTPQAVCARQSAPLRVLRRAVDCGWGGVTRVVSHLVRPQRHLVCFGPAALCALPRPLVQRARGPWDPRARSSTGAACGGAPPSRPLSPTTACAPPITCLPPACLSVRRRRLPPLPLPLSR